MEEEKKGNKSLHQPSVTVQEGVFQLQSIAGEDFHLLPKGLIAPRSIDEARAVYREELVDLVLKGLREICNDHNRPGVYIQGPEGAGKSLLLYTVAQIAKFHLNWITVYVPNCKPWATMKETEAMGFFLDRVVDAFSVEHLQKKNKDFEEIYLELQNPPKGTNKKFADPSRAWSKVAHIDPSAVTKMYHSVCEFLQYNHKNLPVLLIFHEVNALWPEKKPSVIDETPWSLAQFSAPALKHGALLVSGTTDCQFVSESIPAGANDIKVSVGPLEPSELDALLKIKKFKPLHDLRESDEELWRTVADSCGNIPRELEMVCRILEDVNGQLMAKRERSGDNDDEEPPSKKLRAAIDAARSNSSSDHQAKLDKALQRDTSGVFKTRLSDSCREIFLYGHPARVDRTTLRVPNWVISKNGTRMHPTTSDVQAVYFAWFKKNCEDNDQEEAMLLDTVSSTGYNGGERGNALERLLASKLTRMTESNLIYRQLRYKNATEFCTNSIQIPLVVKHRLFKYAADPPENFQVYEDDTLCTHLDQHGGEAHLDLIHYRKNRVVYIEVTVSNYCDTKIPRQAGDARETAIVNSVQKWLGTNTFEVSLEKIPSADQGLETAPKKLVATYKQVRSSGRRSRPDPPDLYYIVAMTCPRSVKLARDRTNWFNWIGVSFLEDLIAAKLIPEDFQTGILNAQAKNAGRPAELSV